MADSKTSTNIYKISKEDTLIKIFKQSKSKPVIIMFSLKTCVYCKRIKPLYKELANQNKNILFIIISGDDYRDGKLDLLSGIKGYPTFLFYYRQKLIEKIDEEDENKLIVTVKIMNTLSERINEIDESYETRMCETLAKAYTDEVKRIQQQEAIKQNFARQLELQRIMIARQQQIMNSQTLRQEHEQPTSLRAQVLNEPSDAKQEIHETGEAQVIPEEDTDEEVKRYVSPNTTTKHIEEAKEHKESAPEQKRISSAFAESEQSATRRALFHSTDSSVEEQKTKKQKGKHKSIVVYRREPEQPRQPMMPMQPMIPMNPLLYQQMMMQQQMLRMPQFHY